MTPPRGQRGECHLRSCKRQAAEWGLKTRRPWLAGEDLHVCVCVCVWGGDSQNDDIKHHVFPKKQKMYQLKMQTRDRSGPRQAGGSLGLLRG